MGTHFEGPGSEWQVAKAHLDSDKAKRRGVQVEYHQEAKVAERSDQPG